jgi:hypothetical protein
MVIVELQSLPKAEACASIETILFTAKGVLDDLSLNLKFEGNPFLK